MKNFVIIMKDVYEYTKSNPSNVTMQMIADAVIEYVAKCTVNGVYRGDPHYIQHGKKTQ